MCENKGREFGGAPVQASSLVQKIWLTHQSTKLSCEAPLGKHFTAFFQSVAVLHGAYRGWCPCPDAHGSCCGPCSDRICSDRKPLLMIRADAYTGTNVAQHSTPKNPATQPDTAGRHTQK